MNWIKIMTNILDHRKIKLIRKGPEGNTLVLLWLLLLVEAGKSNRGGYLLVTERVPYTCETIAMLTDIPLPTVQLGMAMFQRLGMVVLEEDIIYIRNWTKYQSEEKLALVREKNRVRQQKFREKNRRNLALDAPPNVTGTCDSNVTSHDRTEQNGTEKIETTTDPQETVEELLGHVPIAYQKQKTIRTMLESFLDSKGFAYVKRNILYSVQHSTQEGKFRAYLGLALQDDFAAGDAENNQANKEKNKWKVQPWQKFRDVSTGLVHEVDECGFIRFQLGEATPQSAITELWRQGQLVEVID